MIKGKLLSGGLCGLLFLSVFCNDEKSTNPTGLEPSDTIPSYGGFVVSLEAPDGITATYTQLQGGLKDGKTPQPVIWEQADAVGNCRLMIPRIPVCDDDCGEGICVDDNICKNYPSGLYAGKIKVSGLKNTGSSATFTMDTVRFSYQLPSGLSLFYPPFDEGDPITFTADGSSKIPPFTFTTNGISPLMVYNDTISLIDGEPINLRWAPPKSGNTTISVEIDISHHGGTKGIIECECQDNGSLEIPAVLLGKLKNLGMAGFPKITITRRAIATSPVTNATLALESTVVKILNIPGLISCWGESEDECPDGKVCEDMRCK